MGVRLIKIIDKYLGVPLCVVLGLASKLFPKKEVKLKRILVLQLWGIGESILTLPAIKALKNKFPKAGIDVLVTKRNYDVYSGLRFFDGLRLISLNILSILFFIFRNIRRYDLVIDFEEYLNISALVCFFVGKKRIGFSGQPRSLLYTDKVRYNDKQHVVQTHLDLLKPLGVKYEAERLEGLYVKEQDKKFIGRMFDFKRMAGIAPGAAESAKSRMWPKENYAAVADKLIEKGYVIVFIGSKEESGMIEEIIKEMRSKEKAINAAGKINLKQTFYLISKCRLFIGNDSGPMHIAAAMGVKTIGLFGPNLPIRWAPYGKGNISIYKGKACKYSPCINVHLGQVPECRFGDDNRCMKAIKVNDVLGAVRLR